MNHYKYQHAKLTHVGPDPVNDNDNDNDTVCCHDSEFVSCKLLNRSECSLTSMYCYCCHKYIIVIHHN